jgi:hypothetical protein
MGETKEPLNEVYSNAVQIYLTFIWYILKGGLWSRAGVGQLIKYDRVYQIG